ncbi:hypothetical protein QR680_004857 [Steinernema hermaphroditum]|uniref:Uncharacterized protein n=1 Tax=Steinernema hermaphroditum TaxID=289476 RepID=A0AA39HR57_9BILA|nr:hypothetical protein QR680_004857 [Steinernema hermaphroditum]
MLMCTLCLPDYLQNNAIGKPCSLLGLNLVGSFLDLKSSTRPRQFHSDEDVIINNSMKVNVKPESSMDLQRAALAAINAQTRNLLCLLPYKILSASKLNSTGYEVKFEVIQSECLASKLRAGAATRNRGKHFVYVVMLG